MRPFFDLILFIQNLILTDKLFVQIIIAFMKFFKKELMLFE